MLIGENLDCYNFEKQDYRQWGMNIVAYYDLASAPDAIKLPPVWEILDPPLSWPRNG